jgi:hypothetical protein
MVIPAGRLFSLLVVIVAVTTVSASEHHSKPLTHDQLSHSTITAIHTVATPTISTRVFTDTTRFKIQLVRTGWRYQAGKRYWAWEGTDAVIVNNTQDAAWFYLKDGQLRSDHKYANLDRTNGYAIVELSRKPTRRGTLFGRDKWGNIDLTGNEFTYGQGHARFCVSPDGNIFAIASKHPQFRCDGVGLKPRGKFMPMLFGRLYG